MKKALAFLLAITLLAGMSMTAFAANPKITDVSSGALRASYEDEMKPGGRIDIDFALDAFTFDQSVSVITKSMLNNADIDHKETYAKGKDLIKSVEVVKETTNYSAFIRVQLVDNLNAVKEQTVDMTVALYKGSKRVDSIKLKFTVEPEVVYVDSTYDYVDISSGEAIEAEEYVREIEVMLHENVTIDAKLSKGKRYAGYCEFEIKEADEKVVDRYSEIVDILRMNTTNLKGEGKIVYIDMYELYYVYNAEGKYVGTTEEKLPYSDIYYLADKKINMTNSSDNEEEEEEEEEEYIEEEEVVSNTSTSASPSYDVNDNPSTGAANYVGLALAAVVAAAAIMKRSAKR